jgi:adenine-specific DNA methylase
MKLMQDTTQEKLRGGFYTPEPIADFILKWAMNGNKKYDILEPSCGDGVFLEQIKNNSLKYNSITAVELDNVEAQKARNIIMPNKIVLNKDFHAYCNSTKQKFDLIIGNPPYIRYQFFDRKQQIEAEKIFSKEGLAYSKLTNPWVSFVVGSSLLLKETGKIGFVLPAELLQVSYAKQLRTFLASFYNKINIISFKKLVFSDIQQEVILLLCEKNNTDSHLIEHLELEDASKLQTLDVTKLKSPKKRIDFKSNKWTFYFLKQAEIDFIEKLLHQKTILPFGHYASVEVGMTTGDNKFFTVPQSVVKEYYLQKYAKPTVGRSVQVPSVIFNKTDWGLNSDAEARAYFLEFPTVKELKNKKVLEYIKKGEKDRINELYKCSIRAEWQIVPSVWAPEALFVRRNHIYPKLIINKAKAYTTDTMHRVTVSKNVKLTSNKKINLNSFVASYYNSVSLAFAEICGRSHGGGALELMPSEVENILIPYNDENEDILEHINKMMRDGKNIDEILSFTDEVVLKKRCGFSDKDIKLINSIWKKLLNRRLGRNGSYTISIKKGSVSPSSGA